jgi:two-component system, OmpR family, copper resistance phosphate regulon response regulator CusR
MRVLVIEDEAKTANYLQKGLSEHGFVVDATASGEDGVKMAKEVKYDMIILDIMLPGRDGWSVMQELKATHAQVPILCLTARDTVADRVKGLELGADDYLVKPFAFSELLARLRSVMRRSPQRQPTNLKIADLEMDLVGHRVSRSGKRIDLTPKEFALLSLLMRREGEVLSRTMIAEQIWDMNFNSDSNVVDVHVRRLRSKMDDAHENKLVHTVRGVGYVLEERA